MIRRFVSVISLIVAAVICCRGSSRDLASLKHHETVGTLRVANLYADSNGQIVGAKFREIRSGTPIYLFEIETVPQVFMWVDTPAQSNAGLAHSLEHLLAGKGTKGRYVSLLKEMRLSRSAAGTTDDFNLYSFSSGTGLDGFFEQFHAWLDALYRPDFTDLEAEREFYHFGISLDPSTRKKTLVEQGSVYDEMQAGQGAYTYYFELNKRVLGNSNPFGFYAGGVPAEMRHVTPADIRQFYTKHYRLGPTTGFIFAVAPKEDVRHFLERISKELADFTASNTPQEIPKTSVTPKYPIQPAPVTEIATFPFPSNSETDRGEVRFGWKPIRTESQIDVKLLQLFFRALADGDKSLLYKSFIDSRTREFDSGATNIESLVFLGNSPFFPCEFVGFSGIAGKQLTVGRIQQLRSRITARIADISRYPDHSEDLTAFTRLVSSYMQAWRRSQRVWLRSAPRFGLGYDTDWKEYLEYLEMDPSFIRSISDDPAWAAVEKRIQSGENIWRGLIREFQLLEVPYATASVPSTELQQQMEHARKRRIYEKVRELMEHYHSDEQEALTRFEQEEIRKTKEIDKIAAQVRRPSFTDHPPLTPDDDIRYTQFHLSNVPVIAAFFDRAPTIDLGLSFDLGKIPRKYYKYLPIFPRCLDSLGLKGADKTTSYADLQAQTQSEMNDFLITYDFNPVSHRGDLRIQGSTMSPEEFRRALSLIQQMTTLNYLDISNADRLRDVVDKRLWEDDAFSKGEDDYWFMNPSRAFRYQNDPLYLALSSVFTRAHWDERLKWLLHRPVGPQQIKRLAVFAEMTLAPLSGLSARELAEKLATLKATGLEGELLEYWKRSIPAFPEDRLLPGLRNLAVEVQQDLTTGPERTIADLREMQRIIINRQALRVDLTLDGAQLGQIEPALVSFLESIPNSLNRNLGNSGGVAETNPLMANLKRRYNLAKTDFPWYVGFEDPRGTTASMVFFADFPGYTQLDRESLLKLLSGNLAAGSGPHTFFMKTQEDGLADGSSVYSDPRLRALQYFAARSPDITALIQLVNSIAQTIPSLRDPFLIDYALQETFPTPRSMLTFTERGRGLAKDIRDGNEPETVRRFSQAILKLRNEPNLLTELTNAAMHSICPVLVTGQCAQQQLDSRSLFFFVGPERLLADAEKKLDMPKLLRLHTADFWIDYPDGSDQTQPTGPSRANSISPPN